MNVASWTYFTKGFSLVICWLQIVLGNHPCPAQCICEPGKTSGEATAVSCVGVNLQKVTT